MILGEDDIIDRMGPNYLFLKKGFEASTKNERNRDVIHRTIRSE